MTAHGWSHHTSWHLGWASCRRCGATVRYDPSTDYEAILEMVSKEPPCDENLVKNISES